MPFPRLKPSTDTGGTNLNAPYTVYSPPQMIRGAGPGPRSILVVEYETAAGQSVDSGAGSGEIINYATKLVDTHNAVTVGASWVFTAPFTLGYSMAASIQWASTDTWAAGEVTNLSLYKNGANFRLLDRWDIHTTSGAALYVRPLHNGYDGYLEKGETLACFAIQVSGGRWRWWQAH